MKNFLGNFASYRFLVPVLAVLAFFSTGAAFAADAPLDVGGFLSQVVQAFHDFGGMSWGLKVSTICLLVVGSMKVDAVSHVIWDKPWFEKFKPFVAPALALVGGLTSLGSGLDLPKALAYMGAGLGANYLFALLDAIKVPAAGNSLVMGIIGVIQAVLSKGESEAQPK